MYSNRIRNYLSRCKFPSEIGHIVCGVSGGADSGALLIMASLWADTVGASVTAACVDHGLRDESRHEADRVRELAGLVGADFVLHEASIDDGPNLEARAREARIELLGTECLLGHTADDQAETVLIRLLRGSGIDGLAGMRHDRRPLLFLRRDDTEAICGDFGYDYVVDKSNFDARFVRNRIRRELIPLMCDIANRDVVPLLVRTAALAAEESDYLNSAAVSSRIDPGDAVAVSQSDPVMAKRVLRAALETDGTAPDLAAILRVMAVARGESPRTEILGGRTISCEGGRMLCDGDGLVL